MPNLILDIQYRCLNPKLFKFQTWNGYGVNETYRTITMKLKTTVKMMESTNPPMKTIQLPLVNQKTAMFIFIPKDKATFENEEKEFVKDGIQSKVRHFDEFAKEKNISLEMPRSSTIIEQYGINILIMFMTLIFSSSYRMDFHTTMNMKDGLKAMGGSKIFGMDNMTGFKIGGGDGQALPLGDFYVCAGIKLNFAKDKRVSIGEICLSSSLVI